MNSDSEITKRDKTNLRFEEIEGKLVKLLLLQNPVLGTELAIPGEHDGFLPPVEKELRIHMLAEMRDLALQLKEISSVSTNPVTRYEKIDSDLAVAGVKGMEILESASVPTERAPDWYVGTALSGIYSLMLRSDMSLDEKVFYITSRLREIPSFFRIAENQIHKPSRVLVNTAIGDLEGAMDFCQNTLGEFINSIQEKETRAQMFFEQKACLRSILDFKRFVNEMTLDCVEDFAIGESNFNMLLKEVHHIPYDSAELLSLGNEVAEQIEQRLKTLSRQNAGHDRWWETLAPLSDNHPSAEMLLSEYNKSINKSKEFVATHKLVDLSVAFPLEVLTTPLFARTNLPFAAYIAAPPFATNGRAQFWVTPPSAQLTSVETTKLLRVHHIGRILVACVHEAYPGHHVQFSHAARVKRPLRHIFSSTVFTEGWALYCEDLMRESGFMQEDSNAGLLEMSMLRDQLWRALRIVLDVGLHCKNMSQNEATNVLVNRYVLDPESAKAEVMYYCSAPTQPMSYMVGKLLIKDLIKKCQASNDKRFSSLFNIHNELLSHGALPISLLNRAMGVPKLY